MQDIHKNDLSLVKDTLKKLQRNIYNLEDYISDKLYDSLRLSDIITTTSALDSDFDINMFKELLQEVHESLLISLERVKDFRGLELDENWYNYKNYYQFENIVLKKISYQNLLDDLRTIKIRIVDHVWQLHMIKVSLYFEILYSGAITLDRAELLSNNNVKEWNAFLDEYLLRNRKIIDNS